MDKLGKGPHGPVSDQFMRHYYGARKGTTVTDESEKALLARIERADMIILLLTADHNTGPNYVKGFDAAKEYFQDYAQTNGRLYSMRPE